jgi:hypothetical protein
LDHGADGCQYATGMDVGRPNGYEQWYRRIPHHISTKTLPKLIDWDGKPRQFLSMLYPQLQWRHISSWMLYGACQHVWTAPK